MSRLRQFTTKHLVADARWIAKHAWSMRFLYGAWLLTGAAIAVPLIAPAVPNEWLIAYGVLVLVVITAAMAARFIAQRKTKGGDIGAL